MFFVNSDEKELFYFGKLIYICTRNYTVDVAQ